MNTDSSELTDEEYDENKRLGVRMDRMKIIETNGGFSKFKDYVFAAVVIGMGGLIITQQITNSGFAKQKDIDDLRNQNSDFAREIAVLKIECKNNTQVRGGG